MKRVSFLGKNKVNVLIRFLKRNWSANHILSKNKELLRWMYYDKKNKKYNFIISQDKNKIFSILGVLFQKINHTTICWLTMWAINKNEKNNNGIDLLKYIFKNMKPSFVGTIGCNENVSNIYKHLGFKVDFMEQYYIKNTYLKKFNLIKCSENHYSFKKHKNIRLDIHSDLKFYKKIKNYKTLEKKFLKNYNFFDYKFYKNPFYKYFFLVISNKNKTLGFFSCRTNVFKKTKVLRLVNYFGPDDLLLRVSDSLKEFLNYYNFEYLDFLCFGYKFLKLEKYGFKKNVFKSNKIIPYYFEPFVKKNVKLIFAFWPKNFSFPLFKADCDQDRPNIF